MDEFWSLWSSEYLRHVNHCNKWTGDGRKECYVHDIQELGSQSWPLARIMKTHPGKDGKVRVVTIRMKLQCSVNTLVLG